MTQDTITIAQGQRYRCTKGHEWSAAGASEIPGAIVFPDVSDKTLCQRCWWEWLEAHLGEVESVD